MSLIKTRWWMVVVLAVGVYLAVAGCVVLSSGTSGGGAAADPADEQPILAKGRVEGLPYRGFAMQVQRIDDMMDYGRCVDKIAAIGADTVEFVVDSKQENGSSTQIFLDMRGEPTPDKLGELIDYAHSRKLRVILMPLVLLEAPKGNEWRGQIRPDVWETWWESYRDMLHHYAAIAERYHVEVFVIGSELVSTESMTEEWTRTIRQVRRDYHGTITYSANWDHYTTPKFWDQLDLMGINSYYDLGYNVEHRLKLSHARAKQASVAEINERWAEIKESILNFSRKIHKPALMLEVGWCSMGNAVTEPWDYTQTSEPLDLDVQKRLYEAYFDTWYGQKGFAGFMLWAWTPNASGPQDRGYTPEGKPAEEVVRKWLAKGPWKVE